MARKAKGSGKSAITPVKDTQFVTIHIEKRGSMTVCRATTVDGVTENYIWDRKSHRNTVRLNTSPRARIIVADNVPANQGWDWDWKY